MSPERAWRSTSAAASLEVEPSAESRARSRAFGGETGELLDASACAIPSSIRR